MPFILTENYKTYVFGLNNYGQLGLGHNKTVNIPTELKLSDPLEWFISISCKNHHTIGITNKKKTYVFGSNIYGQLGLGHFNSVNIPTELKLSDSLEPFIFFSCGVNHTVGITNKKKTYIFGRNNFGQLGLGLDYINDISIPTELKLPDLDEWFISISCGDNNTIGITNKKKTYVFGLNYYDQLGSGLKFSSKNIPTELKLTDTNERFISISCGYHHTVGITNKHKTYVFGYNFNGQLGLGHKNSINVPTELKLLDPLEWFISFSCGYYHSIGITNNHKTYIFGDNDNGLLGLGHDVNISIPTELKLSNSYEWFTSLSCGNYYTIGITNKKKTYVFGSNYKGRLGLSHNNNINIPTELILPSRPIKLINQMKLSYDDKIRLLWIAKIKNKKTLINKLPNEIINEIINFL